jgi:hypothetical protein
MKKVDFKNSVYFGDVQKNLPIQMQSTYAPKNNNESVLISSTISNAYATGGRSVVFRGTTNEDLLKRIQTSCTGVEQDGELANYALGRKITIYKLDDKYTYIKSSSDTDNLFRVKYYKDPSHIVERCVAAHIYDTLGIKSAKMSGVKIDNLNGLATEYLENLHPLSTNPAAAYKSFVADAFVGNWNAYNDDNTMIQDGKVIKTNTAGCLNYRARGEKKPFGPIVDELVTFLNPRINPQTAAIFKNMKRKDLLEPLKKFWDMDIDIPHYIRIDKKLKETLIQRHLYIQCFAQQVEATLQGSMDIRTYMETVARNAKSALGEHQANVSHLKRTYTSEDAQKFINKIQYSKPMVDALTKRMLYEQKSHSCGYDFDELAKTYSTTYDTGRLPYLIYSDDRKEQLRTSNIMNYVNVKHSYRNDTYERVKDSSYIENYAWDNIVKRELLEDSAGYNVDGYSGDIIDFGAMDDKTFANLTTRGLFKPFKGYIRPNGFTGIVSEYELRSLAKLSDEHWEIAKKRNLLTDIPGRTEQVTLYSLEKLCAIDDATWAKITARGLLKDMPGTKKAFSAYDVKCFAACEDTLWASAQKRKLVGLSPNGVNILEEDAVEEFAKATDAQWGIITGRKLLHDSNINKHYERYDNEASFGYVYAEHILALAGLDEERWQKVKDYKLTRLGYKNTITFSELSKEKLGRLEQLLGMYPHDEKDVWRKNEEDITRLINLDDTAWAHAQKLFQTNRTLPEDKRLNSVDISSIANLDEEAFKNIEKRNLLSVCAGDIKANSELEALFLVMREVKSNVDTNGVLALARLNDEQWENIEKRGLNSIEGRENQLDGADKAALAMLNEEDWQRVLDRGLLTASIDHYGTGEAIVALIQHIDDEDWKIVEKRKLLEPQPWYDRFSNGEPIRLSVNGIYGAVQLDDEQFGRISELLNIHDEYLFDYELDAALDIASLSSEEYNNIKTRNLHKYRCSLDASPDNCVCMGLVICGLAKFNDEEFARIIEKDYIKKASRVSTIGAYLDLEQLNLADKNTLSALTIQERRKLLKLLIKYNNAIFHKDFQENLGIDTPLVPKNENEYCSLLLKIVKSIGIDTHPISDETKNSYTTAMERLSAPDGKFASTNLDNIQLQLSYPRESFISDVNKLLDSLSFTERAKAIEYFGFEIKNNGKLTMSGYPINTNNGEKLVEITNEQTKSVIEQMRPLVKRFSEQNSVTIAGNPELAKELNDIIKVFPEFLTTVGKIQHKTQDFSLDVHTLKVLQEIVKNPDYQTLSESDKKILQIAALLHDISKLEGVIDHTHPSESAFDAYYLLEKLQMNEHEKLKIYSIIKNHDWLQQYNADNITPEQQLIVANDIAFELRNSNTFELSKILSEADLKSVHRNERFYHKYSSALSQGSDAVRESIQKFRESAIHLPQTQLPSASSLVVDGVNCKEINVDGIINKVVYISKDTDLIKIGFGNMGVDDLNVLVHALDYDTQSAVFQALGQLDSKALLSTSYINYASRNYKVFRKQGFIIGVNSDNTYAAYFRDFGSGNKKSIAQVKKYIFDKARTKEREYISKLVQQKLNLSKEEYAKLYTQIADKSLEELDKTHPKAAKAFREIFGEMESGKRAHGRQYNEVLVSNPKIHGVFTYEQRAEQIPQFLRQYAQDNDLPVIVFND